MMTVTRVRLKDREQNYHKGESESGSFKIITGTNSPYTNWIHMLSDTWRKSR
jgi:hypothetical protein